MSIGDIVSALFSGGDSESAGFEKVAQAIYCQGRNNNIGRFNSIALGALAGAQMLYWGGKYDDYSDDLNGKLIRYRGDLKSQLDHYCKEGEEFTTFAMVEKTLEFGCEEPPAKTEPSQLKTESDNTQLAYGNFLNNLNKTGTGYDPTCDPLAGAKACGLSGAISHMKQFDDNREELWNTSNIEVLAQTTRGQRQLDQEITSLRQIAIDTCQGLLTDAGQGLSSGAQGLGTSASMYRNST